MNNLSSELISLFKKSAIGVGLFKKKAINKNIISYDPWFDKECRGKKAEYLRYRRLAKYSLRAKEKANAFAKEYKRLITKKRRVFLEAFNRELQNMKKDNPKKYWEMLEDKQP